MKIDVFVSVYLWWGEGVFGLEREFDLVHPLSLPSPQEQEPTQQQ